MRQEDKTGGFQRPGNLGDRGESGQVRCRDGGKSVREGIPERSVQRWAGEGDTGGGKPNQEGGSSGGEGAETVAGQKPEQWRGGRAGGEAKDLVSQAEHISKAFFFFYCMIPFM